MYSFDYTHPHLCIVFQSGSIFISRLKILKLIVIVSNSIVQNVQISKTEGELLTLIIIIVFNSHLLNNKRESSRLSSGMRSEVDVLSSYNRQYKSN